MHVKNGTFLEKLYKEHDLILAIDMKQEVQEASHLNENHCLSVAKLTVMLVMLGMTKHFSKNENFFINFITNCF